MRCDTCKHWSAPVTEIDEDMPGWEADKVGYRKCNAVRERWEIMDEAGSRHMIGVSDTDAWQAARIAALAASKAFVQDGSEYMAQLVTAPDFFCALYSPRSAATRLERQL